MAEYVALNYKNKKIIWVGKEKIKNQLPKEFKFVKIDSLKSIPILLKCKYMFFVQMHRADICRYNVYRKAVLCLLDHGIPIKKWAMDDPHYNGKLEYKNLSFFKKIITVLEGENHRYSYITVTSDDSAEFYKSALRYRTDENTKIIKTGTPRNDYLIHLTQKEKENIKLKTANYLGFDVNKTVIAYFPTYRRKTKKVESFLVRDVNEINQLENLLKKYNAVLIEKNHFAADQFQINHQQSFLKNIIKIDKPTNFQELLVATDIQIADYSGGYVDYVLLDRPIIHYLYDYEYYKNNDSGLYYEKEEFAAGTIVDNFDDLYHELENTLKGIDEYADRREKVKKRILQYEDGNACKKICEAVFNNKN